MPLGLIPLNRNQAEKQANAPQKRGKTVNQVFDSLTETHHFKLLAESKQDSYHSMYRRHIADRWGQISVNSIRRSDVVVFLDGIKLDSIHKSVIVGLQRIQQHAIDLELIESQFLFNIHARADGVRDKTLTDDEISRLMNSAAGWDSLRNICKMQLLTGCRVGEIAGMRWDEIDMQEKTWTIPAERIKTEKFYKKMTRPHVLPLMPKMAEILLQQRQHGTDELVFKKIYQTQKRTYYCPGSLGLWLKNEIGILEGTHQLRRTVATRLAEMPGLSEYDIKICLNHAVGGNTGRYIHTQQLERKREIYRLRGYQFSTNSR